MAISYDEYINKKKKKKKEEEPKVVLGYSQKQNNVRNTPRSTTDTQTLIDRYIAEQKNKKTVAPVKKKEGDGLFSAFEDGYQMGDVSKTILKGGKKLGKAVYKTGKEIVTNPVESFKAGMVGIGEGINKANDLTNDAVDDFFDFITGRKKEDKDLSVSIIDIDRFSKTASEEEKQKVLKEYEKKYGKDSQLYKSVELSLNTKGKKEDTNVLNMKYYDTDTYDKAVEGKLSDGQQNIYNIGQTVGNIVPATVVSAVLSPAVGKALFFTQAQQGYTEEARARGYDEKDARIYGMIMGGFEVAVERLGFDELGGFKGLAKGNIIKNMVGEGMEEFVMPYIDDVVTYVGFEDGYGWEEFRESSEEALEGAVMGAVVGGIFSAGGKGLSKVDKVIQKASNGETITQYELIEARDQLQEHSPETLQEAIVGVAEQLKNTEKLGGGKQEEVQDVTSEDIAPVPNETDIIENLQENNIPILEGTEYQQASTTETTVEADETALKSQNYVYQASETDSEYRRNLNEDATKYANNTTRTHEFVNTLANVSEASGLNIRLTNNTSPEMTQRKQAMINSYAKRNNVSVQEASERLKNIVIDGYNVNDQITINVNSPKALNRLVGHEITHSLEKTVVYKTKLQKIAIDYAKSKNDYKSRLDRLIDLYEGQNADINKELTADIIGDYLFTDQKFVDNLYKKDRNLFQRIYDEIKHLFKMATAGSKEARELEKLKHSFEKAMQENKEMSKESKKVTVQETKDKSAVEVESNTQEKEDSVQKTEKEENSNVTESVETETKTEDKVESKIEENIEEDSLGIVDSEGNKLSEEQVEFFEDSVVRDENGNLLVMYHGTSSGGYTVFDPYGGRPGLFGQGSYFTADKTVAESYTQKGKGKNQQIYEVYLNITNPIDMDAQANVEEWEKYFSKHIPDAKFPKSGTNEDLYRFTLEEFENTEYDRFEVAEIMIETFQKMGYDGITHIGGGRFNQKDDTRHRVYITFESNQVKDIDNKNPTKDDDIRYSLSESGEMVDNQGNKVTLEASETGSTRNLMAIHNLNESKLFGVLELGGLAYPSIAVTDPSRISHEGYGKYTILLDKKSIDPKASTRNKVYSRDGYTPTFPKVEYETNKKAIKDLDKIKKTIEKATGSIHHDYWSDVHHFMYELDRYASYGLENIIDNAKNRRGLQYAYLVENGKDIELKTRPERYSDEFSNEELQTLLDNYKGNKDELINISFDEAMTDENKQLIKDTLVNHFLQNRNLDRATAEEIASSEYNTSFRRAETIFRSAGRYYKNGENQVFDQKATNEIIDQELNESDYENWLREKFKDVVTGRKGIYNGSTWVTETGRERGFWQTHDEYNLANVVKLMRREKQTGNNWGFLPGSNVIFAGASKEFKSIKDIKANEDLLQDFSEELYLDKIQPLDDRYTEVREQLVNAYMEKGYESNYFMASDYVNGQISDSAVKWSKKNGNIDTIINTLEDAMIPATREQAQELVDIFTESQKLPTSYFEAKPQRGVGFDEFQAVIIPNDATPEMKQALQDAGLTYYEYDPNIDGDRQRVINQFDELKFSLSRTDDVAPVGENDIFGSDIAVQEQVKEAIAPLQEQIETLTKTISDLQENMAPASFDLAEEQRAETQRTMSDEDAPLTDEGTFSFLDEEVKVKKKQEIINDIASDFNIKKTEARELYNKINSIPEVTIDDVYTELENYRKVKFKEQDDYVKSIQDYIRGTKLDISNIKKQIPDYGNVYRMSNMGKGLILGNSGQGVDTFYQELNELFPNEFPSDVVAEADQLELISQAMYKEKEFTYVDILDDDELQILAERIYTDIGNSERYKHTQSGLYFLNREVKKMAPPGEFNTDISEEEYADSLSTLDASNTEQVEETVSLEEELNELDRQKGPSITKNPFDEVLDKFLEGKRAEKTKAVTPKVEKSKYRNAVDTAQRLFVNEMVESDNLAKETGNLNIKYTGDMLNNVAGEIEGEIYTAQTDNEGHQIGKSLSALFSEAKKTGLYDAFNDYLEQYSNIDRHAQGKGSVVPLADSQRLVRHYEKTYPEFKQWGKGVWQYGANIRNNLIDAGIINEEFAETLGSMYPHYVPYMENREMTNYNPDLGEIKPKGVIKRAKGGADNLLPIEEALTKYTFASKKAVRQNQFYQEIVATLDSKAEVGADVRSDALDLEDTLYRDETGNYLTAYFNGERLSVRISDDLYTGLRNDLKGQIKGLEEKFALITDPVQKLSEWRRNLLTSWNPMFIIKNPIMDVQDALFNSKYTKDFAKNYPKAFVELGQAKSETAKQFLTLYGSGNVMGEYSSDGSVKSNKFLRGIERANNIMELAPRYAEFKASLENGASLQEAMYNAREVTTNFGRGGVITKALNKNGFTFLNVSVQGFDKFIRNFSGENGAKGVTGALLKATLLGVIPAVFNELAFGGDDEEKDEDYDALPDYIKDNYYLIKTGDGQFIRIPKGRILSVFGSAGRRTIEYLQGEEDAFEGYLKNANSQIGISNPLDSNILTPLFQAFGSENGEAWYGGDIVPTRLQSKAPEEQYDASTDKFSIWLGDKIGVSPYKINYVIDQYSGGMGDIFLPFITEESTSDAEGIELALAPIKDQFTANSTFDNKYAGDIYDLSDKMDKMPSSVKETDEYKIQDAYLYSVTSEMGKLYAERRAVQENKELSKKEKYEKVQEIQKQINALAKEGLDNYKDVNSTSNYAIVGGREFNKYKTESGETRWGAVREEELEALNSYGLDIMEKSSYFNAKTYISQAQEKYKDTEDYAQKKRDIIAVIKSTLLTDEAKAYLYDKYYADSETLNTITSLGIDFDKYLDLEYQNFEADKNSAGKSISGSKKAKVFRYINSMDLSFEEKLVLTKLQYNSYNEHNGTVINYINSADLTYEQRVNILKKLGFKVDDYGNIKW